MSIFHTIWSNKKLDFMNYCKQKMDGQPVPELDEVETPKTGECSSRGEWRRALGACTGWVVGR